MANQELCDGEGMVVDEYTHLSPHLIYSNSNIPGGGANISDFETQLIGCDCHEIEQCCAESRCACLQHCGQNYSCGRLLEEKWTHSGIVECNSQCACNPLVCANRVVQFGPLNSLEIFQSSTKGLGLRTTRNIPKGTFICEYAGEVIGMSEAKRRFRSNFELGRMNYIFVLREIIQSSPNDKNVIETIVDPSTIGNIGRYVNHSCDPNAGIVPVRVDCAVPRLGIFAVQDIVAGEEVTYDYSGGDQGKHADILPLPFRKPCFCGADVCFLFLPCDMSLL